MRALFDTNVVLDLLLDREPFGSDAEILFSMVESGKLTGLLCATTVTTIHYLLFRHISNKEAESAIEKLLELFEIAPVNRTVLQEAINACDKDFEDSVIYKSAYHARADIIVTRDIKGFEKSDLPVYSPREIINILQK